MSAAVIAVKADKAFLGALATFFGMEQANFVNGKLVGMKVDTGADVTTILK